MRALAERLTLDVEQVQDREQQIRTAFRVVGEREVTVAGERAVDASDQNRRHLFMGMPMRITHVAALVDEHVIEQAAVPVIRRRELLAEVRKVADVEAIDLRVAGLVRGDVAVVRDAVPAALVAGLGQVILNLSSVNSGLFR